MSGEVILVLSAVNTALSQVLLKKSANRVYERRIDAYLNPLVIVAYLMLGASMLLDIYAFTLIEYKWGPVLASLSYVFVVIFSRVFFNEKITRNKVLGALCIFLGIIIFI